MLRAIAVGIGDTFKRWYKDIVSQYELVALADSDEDMVGKVLFGFQIQAFEKIVEIDTDMVLVCPFFGAVEISQKLLKIGIDEKKIIFYSPSRVGGVYPQYSIYLNHKKDCVAQFKNIKILVRSKEDLFNLKEVFLNNVYEYSMYDESCIVFDIGMNAGLASLYFASHENVKKVYSFEPFPLTYQKAVENFDLNTENIREKICSYNFGLSDLEANRQFPYDSNHSLQMRTDRYVDDLVDMKSETVKIKRAGKVISDILKNNNKERVVVKIDTEGSEERILNDFCSHKILDKIDLILMETHFGSEGVLTKKLKENNFMYFYRYDSDDDTGLIYAVNLNRKKLCF